MTSSALAADRDTNCLKSSRFHHGVATIAQLRSSGISAKSIGSRCRPGGPWRRLSPGVVLLAGGEPTRHQLLNAAVAGLGRGAMITGIDALRAQGANLPPPRTVHVLIPACRRVLPPEFVLVERTARVPDPVDVEGLPCAPVTRAAIDAARRESDPDCLRDLLTVPVYEGLCTPRELHTELESGNQRGSAAVRAELRELSGGWDTFLLGVARRISAEAPLPAPQWDVTVRDRRGKPIGTVDAWWDEAGLGWQFSPRYDEDAGQGRMTHLALTAAGVVLVRTPADRMYHDRQEVIRELVSAFRQAALCPRPKVETTRAVPGQ
ncbi:hypothetical protein [Amycolatopsis palatopharyngis]|uniref:hypothetical protein n=1 Tax=Amycolatopsis palatopharyngis TaxID=187982 RepID=UPI001FEB02B3|nr:hypothetical protein [Amycolatopsis palatopharyngis]